MPKLSGDLEVVHVDISNGKVLVTFSDGTIAAFTAEELADLRPTRTPPEADTED